MGCGHLSKASKFLLQEYTLNNKDFSQKIRYLYELVKKDEETKSSHSKELLNISNYNCLFLLFKLLMRIDLDENIIILAKSDGQFKISKVEEIFIKSQYDINTIRNDINQNILQMLNEILHPNQNEFNKIKNKKISEK